MLTPPTPTASVTPTVTQTPTPTLTPTPLPTATPRSLDPPEAGSEGLSGDWTWPVLTGILPVGLILLVVVLVRLRPRRG